MIIWVWLLSHKKKLGSSTLLESKVAGLQRGSHLATLRETFPLKLQDREWNSTLHGADAELRI